MAVDPTIVSVDPARLNKEQLHALADAMLTEDPRVLSAVVSFIEADTAGIWHGRARAMFARRMKHISVPRVLAARVEKAVVRRLASGSFSEQFKAQIRLLLHRKTASLFEVALKCAEHPKAHVRRYAAWVLDHQRKGAEPCAHANRPKHAIRD